MQEPDVTYTMEGQSKVSRWDSGQSRMSSDMLTKMISRSVRYMEISGGHWRYQADTMRRILSDRRAADRMHVLRVRGTSGIGTEPIPAATENASEVL